MQDWQEQILEREGFNKREMSLYDKLSSAHQEMLNKELEKYPITTDLLISNLNSKSFANELPIGYALSLFQSIYPMESFNIVKFYETFE